jgi:hypothetical protein
MFDRWIPAVAAFLGVVGGMGGAFVGGAVANEGQQQRFENERVERMAELRRVTYVTFIEELEHHFFQGGTPDKARAAQAAVLLVSSASIRQASSAATDAATGDDLSRYTNARDQFIDLAQRELGGAS